MHVCCFDVHYAKNHTSHDSTQARAVYGRNTCNPKELARVDECFWFKTMQHGQVWHVSVARMADKYVLGSDIHIDETKCSDLVPLLNGTFANFHDVIWGNGKAV
ncbi:hypothetical protein DYB36_003870 [Aphanomyces astaci]|uniref:Uncharacterized protein n=1 Tax=Aphanomyces astaci TaxID=112090 RepID=A0A397BHR8_APHAT|nr:hypothetical protein DYB36_003870 [Aphanomyces astaci]